MISGFAIAVIPALLLPGLLLHLRIPLVFALGPVLPLALVYGRAVRARRPLWAAALALAWAVALSVSTVAVAASAPGEAVRGIWHAGAYRDEMLAWIATGAGPEGDPARFLPRVLVEYLLVLGLASISAGGAALFLGSLLLGYMNGYVGWVIAHADPEVSAWRAALLAWPPWPMARVLSFVLAGTVGAAWGYRRFFDRSAPAAKGLRWLSVASLFFLALDIALKWTLAPTWRGWLAALLGASAGIEAEVGG